MNHHRGTEYHCCSTPARNDRFWRRLILVPPSTSVINIVQLIAKACQGYVTSYIGYTIELSESREALILDTDSGIVCILRA